MALTTAELQAQLDALESAINEGVLKVEYGDKRVQYRRLEEMHQARRELRLQLGLTAKGPRRSVGGTSKGLG